MRKVHRRDDGGNRRGTGKRKRDGDPFGNLSRHVDDLGRAQTDSDRDTERVALATFLESLSDEQRKHLRRDWWKAPLQIQTAIHTWLVEVGARLLLRELRDDWNKFADSLPAQRDPLADLRPSAEKWEEWGFSREQATELARPVVMRDVYASLGAKPEFVEQLTAEHERRAKGANATEPVEAAVWLAARRDKDAETRLLRERASKLSRVFAATAAELAGCLDRLPPDQRPGSEATRSAWADVRAEFSDGCSFADALSAMAAMAEAVAEAVPVEEKPPRGPGRPPDDDAARTAAQALSDMGLKPLQIAVLLERSGLVDYGTRYVDSKGRHVTDLLRKKTAQP